MPGRLRGEHRSLLQAWKALLCQDPQPWVFLGVAASPQGPPITWRDLACSFGPRLQPVGAVGEQEVQANQFCGHLAS